MSLHAATIRAFEWPSHKTITSTQIKVTLLYKFFGKDTGHSKESDFCNPLEQKSPTSEDPRPQDGVFCGMHVNKNSFWDNLSQNKTEAITMNEEKREFIKSSKTGKFTIGLFRTTRPIPGYSSLEEIISEDAVIKHEDIRFTRVSTQGIKCQRKELWDLKRVIEEIEYNILPD